MIPFGTTPHYPLLAPSHSWLRINSFIPNGHLRTGASQKLKTASSYFRFVAFSSLYLPPSNPNSSSYAKHLVKTFKTATKTVRGDKQSLNQKIASCLLSYQPVPPTYRNACLLNCCWWEDVCRRRGALRLDSSKSQLLFFFSDLQPLRETDRSLCLNWSLWLSKPASHQQGPVQISAFRCLHENCFVLPGASKPYVQASAFVYSVIFFFSFCFLVRLLMWKNFPCNPLVASPSAGFLGKKKCLFLPLTASCDTHHFVNPDSGCLLKAAAWLSIKIASEPGSCCINRSSLVGGIFQTQPDK